MRFGSVCSGIEAASVAFGPLGWEAAWFSEIEPFPSAVLAHHHPEVPNLGDMTEIPRRVLTGEIEAPDMLCGGTPCQAFSVAGKRESLADARGNLSLTFCEIANAIDHVRVGRGEQPAIIFWENVPGVLSTRDNAFGCFLGALAGSGCELQPAGGRWTDAGCVYGPQRAVAWRVLDAQYFGLAQRRRRVFVVASARNGFDPAAVLFEFDGVRRDSAPRREAGEGAAEGAGSGAAVSGDSGIPDLARCVTTGEAKRQDWETCTIIPDTSHTLRGEGFDASEDDTGRGTPLVPVSMPAQDVAATLGAGDGNRGWRNDLDSGAFIPVAFDTTQITSAANYSSPKPGDPCHPLAAGAHAPAIAFHSNAQADQLPDSRRDTSISDAPTCSQHAAVAIRTAQTGSNGWGVNTEGVAYTLDSAQQAVAVTVSNGEPRVSDVMGTLDSARESRGTNQQRFVQQHMALRRLTPRECEVLMGFPMDYTLFPWRNKPAAQCPDGPRYKALGNSWAVPVVRWIGRRIQAALS